MRLLAVCAALVLLCASAVGAAGAFFGRMHAAWLSEPLGLLVLGAGFVLLAYPVRRKKTSV